MATEYSPGGFQAFAPWITMQATDYLRGDVAVKGGISALIKIAHLAEAFHMNLEVHHGGNSLNNVANLHVILAIPNTEFFEVSRHQKTSLMRATELSVEQVARAGLRGLERNKFLIIPGWWYQLNFLTASFLPRSLMSTISAAFVK